MVQYLQKFIGTFYKKQPDKPITTSSLINTASLMAKLIVKFIKQKCGHYTKATKTTKRAKNS